MRTPLKPREEIIQDLSKVFRAHGFEGASLTLLTKETGLERASLYHHFPKGKADMAEAVLLQAIAELDAQVVGALEGEGRARARLEDMFRRVEKFYKNGNEVCFITIFSLTEVSSTVSESLRVAIEKWLKRLAKTLTEFKVESPKNSAQQALATIQGGLILAHAMKDPRLFKNALKSLKAGWI